MKVNKPIKTNTMIKHEVKEDRILIEVPETATAEGINKHAEQLAKFCPEARYLLFNYVMVDSGQQVY